MEPSLHPSLDSEELRAVRSRAGAHTAAVLSARQNQPVAKFDPRQAGQFSASQGQGIEALHQDCAGQIGRALGALLQAECELSLSGVEQLPCGDFLGRLPEPAYLGVFSSALESRVLLQVDLAILLPVLDLLLGGSGKENAEPRDLTEIEDEIVEPVGRAISRELDAAWRPLLKMDFAWQGRLPAAQAAEFFTPADRVLALDFTIRVQDVHGRLQLALPSVLSAALLRKLTASEAPPKPRAAQDRGRLREQLLGGLFEAELRLPRSEISLRQLHPLRCGDVVVLKVGPQQPVEVHVAGKRMFLAAPVRSGAQRGAQVQQVVSVASEEPGEEKK
jgi:flagellar motor switch protein FliM